MGVTRALIFPHPIEFIVLPDRVIQHFSWGDGIRPIWTDGRKLPEDPDQPRWWGYSVGHWEGDTFVVDSTGQDERTWIDHFGYPHSEQMHLEERYQAHQLQCPRTQLDDHGSQDVHQTVGRRYQAFPSSGDEGDHDRRWMGRDDGRPMRARRRSGSIRQANPRSNGHKTELVYFRPRLSTYK